MMIRKIVSIITLLLTCYLQVISVFAQQLVVSADKMNIVYIGIDNPLTIVAEQYHCDQVEVFSDGGTLVSLGDCKYIFHPNRPGKCDIIIKARTSAGLKKVGEVTYRIKTLERPVLKIGGKPSGAIEATLFKAQTCITATFDDFEYNAKAIVTKFKITFLRKGKILFNADNVGPTFNAEVKRYMGILQPGDIAFVTEITYMVEAGCPRRYTDMSLTLN